MAQPALWLCSRWVGMGEEAPAATARGRRRWEHARGRGVGARSCTWAWERSSRRGGATCRSGRAAGEWRTRSAAGRRRRLWCDTHRGGQGSNNSVRQQAVARSGEHETRCCRAWQGVRVRASSSWEPQEHSCMLGREVGPQWQRRRLATVATATATAAATRNRARAERRMLQRLTGWHTMVGGGLGA